MLCFQVFNKHATIHIATGVRYSVRTRGKGRIPKGRGNKHGGTKRRLEPED